MTNPRIFWATKKVELSYTEEEKKAHEEFRAKVEEFVKNLTIYEYKEKVE